LNWHHCFQSQSSLSTFQSRYLNESSHQHPQNAWDFFLSPWPNLVLLFLLDFSILTLGNTVFRK
jgi:hypothetical protein